MRIHLYDLGGPETVYWDDVTAVPVPPVNAGFESGSVAPWQAGGGIGLTTTKAHSGSYALSEYIASGNTVAYQDIYGLTPGQAYVVSAWVVASSANGGQVQLALANSINWVQNVVTPGTTWQQISASFTVSSDGWMRVHLYDLGGPETVYWDDVTVSGSLSSNTWSNLVSDPQGVTGINGLNIWENLGFYSVSAAEPTKEYIRLGGQVVVIENGVKP